MESNVEVALAAKMLKIFPPSEDAYLAFPTTGAAFSKAELAIFQRPGESAEDVTLRSHHKAQFARLMNQVPVDGLRWDAEDRLLWDEYKRVLDQAEMATSVLTAAERKSLAAARDYLTDTVTTEDGETTVYSAAVTAYYQYKEAAEEVERTWLDEKLTAELSEDPAVKAAWEGGRRQALEAALAKANQDWAALGHRAEVEKAQATVASLGGKDPQVRRQALVADFGLCTEPDLAANDPVGVLSTFYSPSDVFTPTATWNTLHLTGDEVKSLLADAPAELRSLVTSTADDIRSMTVEYTSITVMRPWFDPTFLAMRSWRMPDGSVVSNGAVPRAGRIPAYISSVVVARKVTIERTVPAGQPSVPATGGRPALKNLGVLAQSLRGVDQQWRVQPAAGPAQDVAVKAEVVQPEPTVAQLRAASTKIGPLDNAVVAAKVQGTTVTRLPSVVTGPALVRMPFAHAATPATAAVGLMSVDAQAAPAPSATSAAAPVDSVVKAVTGILRGRGVHGASPVQTAPPPPVTRPPVQWPGGSGGWGAPGAGSPGSGGWGSPGTSTPPTAPPPPPGVPAGPPATTTEVVEEVDLDGVIVLAYKVRRVPLAPNPDLTLPWSDEEPAAPTTPASTTTPTTPTTSTTPSVPTTSTTPSVPTTRSSTPFPLPAGHCLGAKASAKVHNGTASAADGKAARQLQARLRDLGAAIGVDGHLGKQSDAAIRAFQKKRGLAADGLVGPATWRALFS